MSSTLLTDVVNNNITIPAHGAALTRNRPPQLSAATHSNPNTNHNNNNNDGLIGGSEQTTCKLIAPLNSLRCVCASSTEDGCSCSKVHDADGVGEKPICDRVRSSSMCNQMASNALAAAALYADVGVCDALQQQQLQQKKQCLPGHRRSESATVTTLSHKNSIKSHRRTVSSITTTTFNCPHRKSSTVIVMLTGAGGGKVDKDQRIVHNSLLSIARFVCYSI